MIQERYVEYRFGTINSCDRVHIIASTPFISEMPLCGKVVFKCGKDDNLSITDVDCEDCMETLTYHRYVPMKNRQKLKKKIENKLLKQFEFNLEPGGRFPLHPPRAALFLGAVEWAWSPAHDRLEGYYVSRTRNRKYWILWKKYPDEYDQLVYKIYCAYAGHTGCYGSHGEAGVAMLKAAWTWEKEHVKLGHYHNIVADGALNAEQIEEIGGQIWPEEHYE